MSFFSAAKDHHLLMPDTSQIHVMQLFLDIPSGFLERREGYMDHVHVLLRSTVKNKAYSWGTSEFNDQNISKNNAKYEMSDIYNYIYIYTYET